MKPEKIQALREKFDKWYREQKEINPYIIRDFFLSEISQNFISKEAMKEVIDEKVKHYKSVLGTNTTFELEDKIHALLNLKTHKLLN